MGKQRRIIYNDDGAAEKPVYNPGASVEGFLAAYFNSCVNTQVDSWFYNYGDGWLREDGSLFPKGPFAKARQSAGIFGDANQIIVEAAHKTGMEIFGSLRMNDVHCGSNGIVEPFKLKHPDLLIGGEHWSGKYPHLLSREEPCYDGGYPQESILGQFWAGFDFAKPEVRQYRLNFIRQLSTKYDWDGLELDFMRMPLYFKLGEEGENLDTMTDFMHQVRATLSEIGQKRGRPYPLAARVPPTPELALRTGLDVEKWLREGLIELLIPTTESSLYFTRFKEFVDMGHRYGVPVYLCHSANLWEPHGDPEVEIRSIASNLWAMGADGIYLFNFPYWMKEMKAGGWLSQIGAPNTLVGFDKCYRPEVVYYGSNRGYVITPDPFPKHIVYGAAIEIMVGDDIEEAARKGLVKELLLKVDVDNMHQVEGINIKINNNKVPSDNIKRISKDSFETLLHAPPLRQGINKIVILPGPNSIGRLASIVTGLELWVRYK